MEDLKLYEEKKVVSLEEKMANIKDRKLVISKAQEVKELMESSKNRVDEVDNNVRECKIIVSKTASTFDDLKRTFYYTTFKTTEELLEEVGTENLILQGDEKFELSLNKSNQNYFNLQNIYTGKFTGFILSSLSFVSIVALWLYFAIQTLNIDFKSINLSNIEQEIEPILNWIGGGIIEQKGSMILGALILSFSALLVAWVFYTIRVSMKVNKNLHIAKETYNATEKYTYTQEESQKEMKEIESHLNKTNKQIQNFTILLDEKNAILKRIIYVEGSKMDIQEYHPHSKMIIHDTERLVNTIERLLTTSVTKEGRLNPQSVQALSIADAVYEDFIAKEYI